MTNAEFGRFVDDGGYRRRDAWSEAGWAWKGEAGLEGPKHWGEDGVGRTERFMDRTVPLADGRQRALAAYEELRARSAG